MPAFGKSLAHYRVKADSAHRKEHPVVDCSGVQLTYLALKYSVKSSIEVVAYAKVPCQAVSAAARDDPQSLSCAEKTSCNFVHSAVSTYCDHHLFRGLACKLLCMPRIFGADDLISRIDKVRDNSFLPAVT